MRRSILLVLLGSAACSPSGDKQSTPIAANAGAAIPTGANLRHAEVRTSVAAKEAQAMAVRYFDLIKRRDYIGAQKLWGHGGAQSGGSAKDLATHYQTYTVYEPTVGQPTDVHVTDDMQYVNVSVKIHVKVRKTGKVLDQEGPVMLRRSVDPNTPLSQEREWQIWGMDIRVRH